MGIYLVLNLFIDLSISIFSSLFVCFEEADKPEEKIYYSEGTLNNSPRDWQAEYVLQFIVV